MKCTRCELVPARPAADHVLLCTAHPPTQRRLLDYLSQSNYPAAEHPLGVRLEGGQRRWREMLVLLADVLSGPERHDTRVALMPAEGDLMGGYRAMLEARRLEDVTCHLGHDWLYDVLEMEALTVHHQAMVRYPSRRLFAYECLMRGLDCHGRSIEPRRMYEAAEDLDLLPVLDRRARLAAVRSAARTAGEDAVFFINFRADVIFDARRCFQSTLEAIDAAGLPRGRIVLEAVDAPHRADVAHLGRIRAMCRDNGVRLSLDDVNRNGDGALLLLDAEPDFIRIDVSAGGEGMEEMADAALARGIVPIAKGIETQAQLEAAMAAEIEIVQGRFVAPPQGKMQMRAVVKAM